ncbi:luciferase domain-containing protein [Actinomadura macrotermitis]|uniref:Luciferase domain-containing protein n=1 Tax=Actinomadura macrotermitis TaxID=2585200 RepID=A0A7K0BPW5_9ACTN|nr:luciferase family protein [Actinomadura macrotermitis]MQY03228.1 hypothetical protein [Actinomadura macrotermitis]
MSATPEVRTSPADRTIRHLKGWPALRLCRADCGTGRAFTLGSEQILHLHGPHEAELYLTAPIVQRINGALGECAMVTTRQGSGWVRFRLESETDVALLVSLVSVAIKANTAAASSPSRRIAPCSLGIPTSRRE